MHPWRILSVVGLGVAGFSLFITFATFPFVGGVDGIEADAWPALILLLPTAAVAALGDSSEGVAAGLGLPLLLGACAATVFAMVKTADALIATRSITEASMGLGAIGLVVGCLTVVGALALGTVSRRVVVGSNRPRR